MADLPPGVEPIHLVHDAILDAGEDVDRLSSCVANLTAHDEPADLTEVVKALIHLRAVMRQATETRDALAEYAYHLMPSPQLVIPGIGKVERSGGWNRREWEHDRLASKVLQWARDDREAYARDHDGELPPESEGATVARLMLEYAGIAYWKVGAARDRGLNVDEYCRKDKARRGISLPREDW